MKTQLLGVKYLISVANMDRAVSFYRDVIGLRVLEASPGWSELAHGECVVALHGGGTGGERRTGLSFTVSNLDSLCQELAAAGIRIVSGPEDRGEEGILLAQFVDTEGNHVMASQVVQKIK